MAVDSVNSSTSSTGSTGRLTGQTVEETKQQFLQMLVTQLQNQDPFAPMDSSQFTQQMTQMGQLEQLMSLNENVSSMAASYQGSLISQYSGIVGHQVFAQGSQIQLTDSSSGIMRFSLPSTPAQVEVKVFDSHGNMVRSFEPAISTSGNHEVRFDGKDNQGADLPNGYYSYTVDAVDGEAAPIMATTYSMAAISSIRLENGTPILQIGNEDVTLSDIQQIY